MKNGLLRILKDLDGAGRGKKRDAEEGGMRRKEGRGRRRDGEEGGTRRVKNEKVVKTRPLKLTMRPYNDKMIV